MRKIKFRAWDKRWKEKFLTDSGWIEDDIYLDPNGEVYRMYYEQYNKLDDVDVLIFTGLHDKTGKEIYEGDIIKQFPGFGCEWGERVGSVKYEYASFWFEFGNQGIILDDHDCQFEVIGNIYENPELLKNTQTGPDRSASP